MLSRRKFMCPIELDSQIWLLSACCALYPEEFASYPELRSLRQAIADRHRALIAASLEVACSHLEGGLTNRQVRLTRMLAHEVRLGSSLSIRRTAQALSRASLSRRDRAC